MSKWAYEKFFDNDDAYILNYMNINKFSFAEFPQDIAEDLEINLSL